jgi:hypothetical protein
MLCWLEQSAIFKEKLLYESARAELGEAAHY